MNNLLDLFWEWLGISPEVYAQDGFGYSNGKEECDFPHFVKLISRAEEIVDKNILSNEAINELLIILAIDNEAECMLDYIAEHSTREQLEVIIERGIVHPFYEARWQLAEIIARRKPEKYIEKLQALSGDMHPYVKRRAQNLLCKK